MNLPQVLLIAGLEAVIAISLSDLGAQSPPPVPEKLFQTTAADSTFGEGGKKIIWSDDKDVIRSVDLMDSGDHLRATHKFFYDTDQKTQSEDWLFYSKDNSTRPLGVYEVSHDPHGDGTQFHLVSDYAGGGADHISEDHEHSLADYESFLEMVQKQFATDGTFLDARDVGELVRDKANKPNNAANKAALLECLRSKFPNVTAFGVDTAFDIDSKREFAWREDRQAWIDAKTLESVCPPSEMDPCLVGTWESASFKGQFFTGGGVGFKVTFKNDGTETVDYSTMQPLQAGPRDKFVYAGSATARISTKNGVAKVEKMESLGPTMTLEGAVNHQFGNLPNLGPGGLGSASDNNKYNCTEDTLEYQTSAQRNAKANCAVKLTRVKGLEAEKPPLPPNKSLLPAPDQSKKTPAGPDAGQPQLAPANTDLLSAPGNNKTRPPDQTRAQEAAMLKALEGNSSDTQKQKPEDKAPADSKYCEGLKEDIRKCQSSITSKENEAAQRRLISSKHRFQGDLLKRQAKDNEKKREELIEQSRKEYAAADQEDAEISTLRASQERLRKEIELLMTRLADCKSRPHE